MKRERVALFLLSYGRLVTVHVLWLFLTVPWVGLQCVIVVFPDHTHLLLSSFDTVFPEKRYYLLAISYCILFPNYSLSMNMFCLDNPYFEQMVGQIYSSDQQLNKANSSDTEAPFLYLILSNTNGIVSSTKIYDKRDDFNFEIVNFPFLGEDVPRSPSYVVYISQLICFARVC